MQMGFKGERTLGYQQVTVDTSTGLTIPAGCSLILITVEAQACRWRDDSTAPTAVIGMPLTVGQTLAYSSGNMGQLRFISSVAGSIVNATFYGQG